MSTTYYDPGLWQRLERVIIEEQTVILDTLGQGHWKTLEEGRQLVGRLQGLQWVLDTASEMRKPDEDG
jgi:hypothetical protein